jgi:hypothetical protein
MTNIANTSIEMTRSVKRMVRVSAIGFPILISTAFWKGQTRAMANSINATGSNTMRAK